MECRSFPEAITSILTQRGWSKSKLAREWGRHFTWVGKVMRGERDTPIGEASRLLASVGWEVIIRPKREKLDPVKRREFVTVASAMFIPSPKAGPYEDPANVRDLAGRLARARYEHGGGAVAGTAIRHVRRIEHAITSRDRQLQEAAAELAVQAIWTLNDACRIESGENVGRLALKLAHASESTHAQALAYSALATLNLDHGDIDRALMYAKLGVKLREVPDDQTAWLRLRWGWARAQVGGQEKAARDEIETVRGLLHDSRGFYGQSSFEVADMTGTIGLCLNDLGLYGDAQAAFDECVSAMEQSSPALAAFFLGHQIRAALGSSQVSLGADRMLKLARIAPLVNSPRVDRCVKNVLAQSANWTTVPSIRTARDQLKAVAPAA